MQSKTNIFRRQISLWSNGVFESTPPPRYRVCTIGDFIRWGNTDHYAPLIAEIRATKEEQLRCIARGDATGAKAAKELYTRLKRGVPVAMPQGVNPAHNNADFESYTDVICIDIDAPKSGAPFDVNTVKSKIIKSPFIAYCGLSVGGRGLWVLIPIADHTNHEGHWRALQQDFAAIGVQVDEQAKNIGRLRFMSRDTEAYLNPDAQVYTRIMEMPAPPPAPLSIARKEQAQGQPIVIQWAYTCADDIVARNIDITANYDEWLKAAGAIAHYFGEDGRDLFHTIAAVNDGYKFKENNTLYNGISKPAAKQYGIGSFFRLCYECGVQVPTDAVVYYDLNGYRAKKAAARNAVIPLPPPPPQERINEYFCNGHTSTPERLSHGLVTASQDIVPAYAKTMTPAEALEMQHRVQHIAEGVAMVDAKREQDPTFSEFCDLFECDYCGHDDWHMTAAQFDNFFAERHNATPPF